MKNILKELFYSPMSYFGAILGCVVLYLMFINISDPYGVYGLIYYIPIIVLGGFLIGKMLLHNLFLKIVYKKRRKIAYVMYFVGVPILIFSSLIGITIFMLFLPYEFEFVDNIFAFNSLFSIGILIVSFIIAFYLSKRYKK